MELEAIFYLLSVLCLISGSQIYELKCWTKRNRTRYAGPGLQNSDIDDTIECINKCRENEFCHAVDIDTKTKGNCWYQQNSSFVATESDLQPADTVTNYLYNPTCGEITRYVDLNCWTVTPAHQISTEGMVEVESATLNDCLRQCKSRNKCWVVDWDVKSYRSCSIQLNPIHMPLSNLIAKDSVTNFVLNRDCFDLLRYAGVGFLRVSADTQYTSPGLVQVDIFDIRSCINYCLNNKNCTMVDFDPQTSPPCRAQTNPFPILRGKLAEKSKVYNFLILRKEYDESREMFQVKPLRILKQEYFGEILQYDWSHRGFLADEIFAKLLPIEKKGDGSDIDPA